MSALRILKKPKNANEKTFKWYNRGKGNMYEPPKFNIIMHTVFYIVYV